MRLIILFTYLFIYLQSNKLPNNPISRMHINDSNLIVDDTIILNGYILKVIQFEAKTGKDYAIANKTDFFFFDSLPSIENISVTNVFDMYKYFIVPKRKLSSIILFEHFDKLLFYTF